MEGDGAPCLWGAQASLISEVAESFKFSGHTVVIGRVSGTRVREDIVPLLYENGSYAHSLPVRLGRVPYAVKHTAEQQPNNEETPMIVLIGSFDMEPGQAKSLVPAMEKLTNASRGDAGCVMYSWNVAAENGCIVRLLEVWATEKDLEDHLELPHVGEFVEVFAAAKVTKHKIRIFDANNMRPLGVDFPWEEAEAIW